jgi:hypothetical protein
VIWTCRATKSAADVNEPILQTPGPKLRPHQYVGWALIGTAVVLFVSSLTQIRWNEAYAALVVIPVLALLVGVFAMPGVLVLKRRWGDLARLGSGAVCLVFFCIATNWANEFLRTIDSKMAREPIWAVGGLLIAIGPALLALWLNKKIVQKLRSVLEERAQLDGRGAD